MIYPEGFIMQKFGSGRKMANINGWIIYPVDDITEFYCIFFFGGGGGGRLKIDYDAAVISALSARWRRSRPPPHPPSHHTHTKP